MGKYDKYAKCTKCSCELCSSINAETCDIERHGAKLLTVRVKVDNVCPGKKVAIAVIVYDNCNRILAFKGFTTVVEKKYENQCDHDYCGSIERKLVFVIPDKDEYDPCELRVRTIGNYIYPCEPEI